MHFSSNTLLHQLSTVDSTCISSSNTLLHQLSTADSTCTFALTHYFISYLLLIAHISLTHYFIRYLLLIAHALFVSNTLLHQLSTADSTCTILSLTHYFISYLLLIAYTPLSLTHYFINYLLLKHINNTLTGTQ